MIWMEPIESKSLKDNLWKTKVVVCGGITKDGMSKSKVDQCGVCSLRVKANSVLCMQCGTWFHGRCAGVKGVIMEFSRTFSGRNCEGNVGEAVEQEECFWDEVKITRECLHI